MSGARGLFDYQREAAEAKRGRRIPAHLRLAEESAPTAPVGKAGPKWTREAARLDILGWDYQVRMGQRIWCHEEVNGGHWYREETAVQLNELKREGS